MMRTIVAAVLSLSVAAAAHADGDEDQDWARKAVLSGTAIPLDQVIGVTEEDYNGKVYEVDLVKSDDPLVASLYRLKLVTGDGYLVELLVETTSGHVIGIGGQGVGSVESHPETEPAKQEQHDE